MIEVLITGAKGQLGIDLFNLSKKFRDWNFTFIDIADLDITKTKHTQKYFNTHQFDFLINCAAYTAVDKAENDKDSAYKVNATAVKNLIDGIKQKNTRLIHISTDYVFDGSNNLPYSEEFPTNPQTVYGHSKLKGEKFVLDYTNGMVIRTAWLFSSHGHNFVKSIIKKGGEQSELKVVNDQIGAPTYSKHLADAILKIVKADVSKNISFIPGVYHFTNSGFCSWYDFAIKIVKETNLSCSVRPVKTSEYQLPAKRPEYSVLSLQKIKSTYGLEIPEWTEGLKECLIEMNKYQ